MSDNDAPFSVNLIGEVSQEHWMGEFRCKTRLSHKDHLLKDKVRRELLGNDPNNAGPRAQSIAEIVSQLAIRITKAPPWWQDTENGLTLEDDNLLAKVYECALQVENEHYEELKKKAEEAKKELEKTADELQKETVK